MEFKFTILTAATCIAFSTFVSAQKNPVIVTYKAVEKVTKPAEPSFSGDQISFENNNVIFKEKAGFKTEKIEVQNAEKVIFDKSTLIFHVINAEKIFTSIKIQKQKTNDPQKAGIQYKLNDDVIYITEYIDENLKK